MFSHFESHWSNIFLGWEKSTFDNMYVVQPGLERLSAQLEHIRVWRSGQCGDPAQEPLDSWYSPLQQVSSKIITNLNLLQSNDFSEKQLWLRVHQRNEQISSCICVELAHFVKIFYFIFTIFQRWREVRRNISDQHCRLIWRVHALRSSGNIQEHLQDWHHLVPLRWSELWSQVWLLDIQWLQGR